MVRIAVVVLAALVAAACASRPVALVALPSAPAPTERFPGPGTSVLLRDVALPGYLETFPVVVRRDESVLVVSTDTEWAERPSQGVSRVLRDALSQRLDPSRVVIEGDGRIPDADLTVEFLALEPRGQTLHLEARWLFACTATRASRGDRIRLEVPMAARTPAAVAAATTESLARFADVLARAAPDECPSFGRGVARRGKEMP